MAEKADKETTERRVYVLPIELVHRIREYQESQAIPSEVEAVRRLLDNALQMRDNVFSLLNKVIDRAPSEKDIRIIARDIFAAHPLVKSLNYDDSGSLIFRLNTGESGKVSSTLKTYIDVGDNHDFSWQAWPPTEGTFGAPKPSSSHLDDDIPF